MVAACGSNSPPREAQSDPTDAFYKPERFFPGEKPSKRWHSRKPAFFFETTLRPWAVRASFPSPYLFRITRLHQPWADRIYDKVELAFRPDDTSPIAVNSIAEFVALADDRDAVRLTMGGWTTSFSLPPSEQAKLLTGRIVRDEQGITVIERPYSRTHYRSSPVGELNGSPATISCGPRDCDVDLALPAGWIGSPAVVRDGAEGAGREGLQLRIEFHASRLAEWSKLRQDSLCLAQLALAKSAVKRSTRWGSRACKTVEAAVEQVMREAPLKLKRPVL